MQLALRYKNLVAAVFVIAVVAAAFAVVCPDGLHVPISKSIDGKCAVMTHSSVLGTAVSSGPAPTLTSITLVVAFGLGVTLIFTRATLAVDHGTAPPGQSFDPLNGRLRI